tara:strand:+ start:137 stop:1180 length:1044 start_codon:yes stop_codon:yes gene_type:complete
MILKNQILSVEKFIQLALYDKKYGYYTKKNSFGKSGDFITSPLISKLFSEMISIWIISFWIKLGKPKKFSLVELGPGDGEFCKVLIDVVKKFPEFNKSLKIYLFENSTSLIQVQKKRLKRKKISWIKNFDEIQTGPVLFFGNEFLDAIPIKQFKKKGNIIYERFLSFKNGKFIKEIFKKVDPKTFKKIKYWNLNNKKIIEYPEMGFKVLESICKIIKKNKGGILLIDYGYTSSRGMDTLQSLKRHKRNDLFESVGKADITHLVDFSLLKRFFKMKNLFSNKIVTQSFFLKKLGIIERAEILNKNSLFTEKSDMYYRLERLLSDKKMGELFKVIYASNSKNIFSLGFQ